MATELIIDKADGARLDLSDSGKRLTQPFTIKGLTSSGRCPDTSALLRANQVAGMPQVGELHPDDPTIRLINAQLRGVRADGVVIGDLIYETRQAATPGGYPIERFKVQNRTQLQGVSTQVINGIPIRVYTRLSDRSSPAAYKSKTSNIQFFEPIRNLIASGSDVPAPPDYIANLVGFVNSKPWKGKPGGYWLFYGIDDYVSSLSGEGPHDVQLSFLTRNTRDWCEYAVFEDSEGYLPVPKETTDRLKAKTYVDIRDFANGVWDFEDSATKVAPFPMTDFNTVFTF